MINDEQIQQREEVKEEYNKRINHYQKELKKWNSKSTIVSTLRVVDVLLLLWVIYIMFSTTHISIFQWSMLTLLVIFFLILMKIHSKLFYRIDLLQSLIQIIQNELSYLNNDFSPFEDGKEFVNPEHPYSYDLDLFGTHSIFQAINRTATLAGKNKLADSLNYSCQDVISIQKRQEAILELSKKIDFRQSFQALGKIEKENIANIDNMEQWLHQKPFFIYRPFYKYIQYITPFITCIAWIVYAFTNIPASIPTLLFLFQLFLVGKNLKYINKVCKNVNEYLVLVKKYELLLHKVYAEQFQSQYLQEILKRITTSEGNPYILIHRLKKIVGKLESRNNVIGGILMNGFFLYDIIYVSQVEQWMTKWKDEFKQWIDAIAEIDELCCWGNFQYNNPSYASPHIVDGPFQLDAKALSHPLLPLENRVSNDFHQEGTADFYIVTGANMAGKSTFLRTIGVNMVLAMAGAPVCAEALILTPTHLYTSMRNTDSIQSSTSYFFAELKRLKNIIDHLRDGVQAYVLLDEILKGTNSKDQHSGASRLIENLLRKNATGIIATHDIELTQEVEKYPNHLHNIAFEIEIDNDKMIFDYKYKPGVCKNMNATYLMQSMNIFS